MPHNQLAKFRNAKIGFVFQQFNLLARTTAEDNVALPLLSAGIGKKERSERALECLDLLGLSDRSHHHPSQLSGGQQQRVAAARALIGSHELIIADEPSSALDHDTRSAFIELLMQECHSSGATLIFVSHDPSLEPLFDRSVQLQDINLQGIKQ